MPDLRIERRCRGLVVGVDEAGRGPWAGPVIAAAVLLPHRLPRALAGGLDDSKKLSPETRGELFSRLREHARIGIGRADVAEIDAVNILQASLQAMTRAVDDLGCSPDHVLVDGNRLPVLSCPATAVVGGDALSLSIAAASIVAKVTRDRLMIDLDGLFPGYGWDRNVGYGTPEHQAALLRLGVSPHHRRSFAPICNML